MSKILIVSKTKISDNYVCVGGIDLDKSLSVRLLNEAGRHELKRDCPYNIRDIWNIEYCKNQTRPLPHSEDVCVTFRSKMRELKPDSEMIDILKFQKYPVNHGNIRNVFEGKLKDDDVVSFYISKGNVPSCSTCFWICDKELERDYREKIRYHYADGTKHWIKYVGMDDNPPQIIPHNTLIRLSLAHWWSPEDSENAERCYLQLSGWY